MTSCDGGSGLRLSKYPPVPEEIEYWGHYNLESSWLKKFRVALETSRQTGGYRLY